jgi:hypothetical protein
MAAVDLNDDGLPDMALGEAYAIQCRSPGMFYPMAMSQTPLTFPLAGFNQGMAQTSFIYDLNADGKPDLITFDMPGNAMFLEVAQQ